jgi:hypothetical protein
LALRLASNSPLAILLQQFFSLQQSSLQFIFPSTILFPSKASHSKKGKSPRAKSESLKQKASPPFCPPSASLLYQW